MNEVLARLGLLEDERDIARVVASYGPLVDAADADGVADLWTEDGVYQVDDWTMRGRSEIRAMVNSPQHRALVAGGCCHLLGPSVVTVSGESATAVCASLILRRRDGDFAVFRASANHFELRRTDTGWKITARSAHALTGGAGVWDLVRTVFG